MHTLPDPDEFERIAQAAYDALPLEFREAAGNLVIHVVDWPSRGILRRMGVDTAYGLLGLYHGTGQPFRDAESVPRGPDMISLYRQPILAYAEAMRQPPGAVITHVLIHEIGHHFGFSDADMEAIEAEDGDA
jgi:predicted Zn-dependent protease with MMP-like domain